MTEHCKACGNPRSGGLILKPYCASCWPNECPDCGEPSNYHWSLVNERLECDQGCRIKNPVEDSL